MGLGNMITRLFGGKENKNLADASDVESDDIYSIIQPPKPRTKSFVISKTINFYSNESFRKAEKKANKTVSTTNKD